MSMERMRNIDNWLGIPLCLCLGVLARLLAKCLPRRRLVPTSPQRIVVMKLFGMGSVILAGPLLRAIRQQHPRSALIFLTFDRTAAAAKQMGICTEVREIRTDGFLRFAADALRHAYGFVRQPADVCIDLETFSKFSTLMSVLTWAPVHVGFHLNSFWRYSLVTHPIYYNYYRHVSEVYNDAAAVIGVTVTDRHPIPLQVNPAALERCRESLRTAGWNGTDRLVGINVNAGELSVERRWPRERFAAIIERLAAHMDARRRELGIVLTGASDEVAYVSDLICLLSEGARRRVINMAGRFSFDEFVASMDLYDFVLTNDSGPLHVAYVQGVPTISLWGPGRPEFYGPRHGCHSTFYERLPCSPCLYVFTSEAGKWCDHRADCMSAIEVDEVWPAVQAYIDNPPGERLRMAAGQGRMRQPQ